jgi:hypothetical protein
MGRIIDRLHSELIPHDPAREWSPCCVGCTIASRKLCEMFGWNRRRGTVIPYAKTPLAQLVRHEVA